MTTRIDRNTHFLQHVFGVEPSAARRGAERFEAAGLTLTAVHLPSVIIEGVGEVTGDDAAWLCELVAEFNARDLEKLVAVEQDRQAK